MRPRLLCGFGLPNKSGQVQDALRDRQVADCSGIIRSFIQQGAGTGLLQALVKDERQRRLARAISPFEPGLVRMARYLSVDRKIDTIALPKTAWAVRSRPRIRRQQHGQSSN